MELSEMNSDFTTVVNDDDLLTSDFGTQSQIFTNNHGESTIFEIDEKEIDRMNLIRLIQRHGGKIGQGSGILISSTVNPFRDSYKPLYIYKSVKEGLPLLLQNYRTDGGKGISSRISERPSSNSKVNTNNHAPGNHNRSFDQQLIPSGQPSSFSLSERYVSMNKNGFTEDEDNFIIEEVRRNPSRRNTHKLYHEIAAKLKRHTGNSVRYRFRNLLCSKMDYVYKTDVQGNLFLDDNNQPIPIKELPKTLKNKFTATDDYNLCKEILTLIDLKENEEVPERVSVPSSLFQSLETKFPNHTKSAWRDRYRKFASSYGIDKYVRYYELTLNNGNEPEPMKNFTSRSLQNRKKSQEVKAINISNENNTKDEIKVKQTPLDDEIGNHHHIVNPSDVSRSLSTMSVIQNHNQHSNATPDSVNIFMSREADSFTQLNSERFFNESFFEIPKDELPEKIKEVVERNYSGDHSAEELIEELFNEIGILKNFGHEIIYSVCGDVALIYTYIDQFIKTGQNPPLNCPGIWNKDYDAMLKSEKRDNYNKLLEIHGENRIIMRKDFLEILEQSSQ